MAPLRKEQSISLGYGSAIIMIIVFVAMVARGCDKRSEEIRRHERQQYVASWLDKMGVNETARSVDCIDYRCRYTCTVSHRVNNTLQLFELECFDGAADCGSSTWNCAPAHETKR